MLKTACCARQRRVEDRNSYHQTLPWSFEHCVDCPQGRKIRRELGEQVPPKRTTLRVVPIGDCSVLKCSGAVYAHGICQACYARWRRGDEAMVEHMGKAFEPALLSDRQRVARENRSKKPGGEAMVDKKECLMPDCTNLVRARGLCDGHYFKWRNGDPEVVGVMGEFKRVRPPRAKKSGCPDQDGSGVAGKTAEETADSSVVAPEGSGLETGPATRSWHAAEYTPQPGPIKAHPLPEGQEGAPVRGAASPGGAIPGEIFAGGMGSDVVALAMGPAATMGHLIRYVLKDDDAGLKAFAIGFKCGMEAAHAGLQPGAVQDG
jgi:hypothetical protein